jgi:hypothetical protein
MNAHTTSKMTRSSLSRRVQNTTSLFQQKKVFFLRRESRSKGRLMDMFLRPVQINDSWVMMQDIMCMGFMSRRRAGSVHHHTFFLG